MNFIFGKFPEVRRVSAQNAKGLAAAGNCDSHAADHSMVEQKRGTFEAVLSGKVFDHYRLSRSQREARLGPRIGRDAYGAN